MLMIRKARPEEEDRRRCGRSWTRRKVAVGDKIKDQDGWGNEEDESTERRRQER
jgi:hypothetical protein